jgi:hypothetical protein
MTTVPMQFTAAITAVPVMKNDPLVPHVTLESEYVNAFVSVALPSGFVTTTLFAPEVTEIGVVIEIAVSVIELMVAAFPPTVTPVVPVKFVPTIVVDVPLFFAP